MFKWIKIIIIFSLLGYFNVLDSMSIAKFAIIGFVIYQMAFGFKSRSNKARKKIEDMYKY